MQGNPENVKKKTVEKESMMFVPQVTIKEEDDPGKGQPNGTLGKSLITRLYTLYLKKKKAFKETHKKYI